MKKIQMYFSSYLWYDRYDMEKDHLDHNNRSIRISDEIFHLNGESTLFSLRNGGGRSVLVQMMTAPFVHKRCRDDKERPFESFLQRSSALLDRLHRIKGRS